MAGRVNFGERPSDLDKKVKRDLETPPSTSIVSVISVGREHLSDAISPHESYEVSRELKDVDSNRN